jgi:uncharacterized protein YacL
VTEATIGSLAFNCISFMISFTSISMLMRGDYRTAQRNNALVIVETVLLIVALLTGFIFYVLSFGGPLTYSLDQYYVLLVPLLSAILAVLMYYTIVGQRRAKARRLELDRRIEERSVSVARSEQQHLRK